MSEDKIKIIAGIIVGCLTAILQALTAFGYACLFAWALQWAASHSVLHLAADSLPMIDLQLLPAPTSTAPAAPTEHNLSHHGLVPNNAIECISRPVRGKG